MARIIYIVPRKVRRRFPVSSGMLAVLILTALALGIACRLLWWTATGE